jgi:hypothetical protein
MFGLIKLQYLLKNRLQKKLVNMDPENDMKKISRTEEIRDIIDRMPFKTGRIVAAIVVTLAFFILLFGWLIEYPEKVTGPVSITASKAPVRIVANTSGKLRLLKTNSDYLNENEIIAYIDNPAMLEDVKTVEKFVDEVNPDSLVNCPVIPFKSTSPVLGDLSMSYYSFLNSLEKIGQYHSSRPYEKRKLNLETLLKSQNRLLEENRQQMDTKIKTLTIAGKGVHRDSSLFNSSTISESDMDRSSACYLEVLESTQAMNREITLLKIQIDNSIQEIELLLLEQQETEQKLRMDLYSSFNDLSVNIDKWKLTYVFIAPFSGKLEYLNFWRENDFISAGTPVLSVIPVDNPLLGQILLPSQGAGKVAVGQKVIIRLDDFPYIEYGSVNGLVRSISALSSQVYDYTGKNNINTYMVAVDLPEKLTTNYGARLDFKYEIKGMADILIKKRKLIERIFGNLKYIVSKK